MTTEDTTSNIVPIVFPYQSISERDYILNTIHLLTKKSAFANEQPVLPENIGVSPLRNQINCIIVFLDDDRDFSLKVYHTQHFLSILERIPSYRLVPFFEFYYLARTPYYLFRLFSEETKLQNNDYLNNFIYNPSSVRRRTTEHFTF